MLVDKPARRPRSGPESLLQGNRVPLGQRISALVQSMQTCTVNGKALNFSEAAHREITEALRTVVYDVDPSVPAGAKLKVQYGDGSTGPSLRVRCLTAVPHGPVDEKRSLHVGTLSFRHLDYDDRIDLYLLRDRETRPLSNREVDDLAYDRMKELIEDSALRRTESHIVLFQTGLEPLIVGAYRAIIEELIVRRSQQLPALTVQPRFFAEEDRAGDGRLWT
jgi:hypothetical protein